jgi:predicted PurR-regulated permease PerM
MDRYPTAFQRRTLWNAVTGMAILILGALLVGLIWLLGQLFGFLQPVLVPVIVAGIIAYVLDPAVCFLEKRRMNRFWAVSSIFAAILLAILLLVAAILPGVQRGHSNVKQWLGKHSTEQTQSNTQDGSDDAQRLSSQLERELRTIDQAHKNNLLGWILTEVDDAGNPVAEPNGGNDARTLPSFSKSRGGRIVFQYKGAIFETTRAWITAGSTKILGILGFALGMIMVPIYLFFFLKDSAGIRAHWHDYVPLRASRFKRDLVDTLQEINGYLVSFFRGQVLVALIDGMLVGIALSIFGLPYALIIGVLLAVIGVIPYIGNIICLVPACIIAWLHAQGGQAAFDMEPWAYVGTVVAIFIVVQQINSLVTAPKIVGDSVGLHPLTVIFSMLFWTLVLGGFAGALLAVPLTAAVKVLFRRFIWARNHRQEDQVDGAIAEASATEELV